jgi:hypothetical protein
MFAINESLRASYVKRRGGKEVLQPERPFSTRGAYLYVTGNPVS